MGRKTHTKIPKQAAAPLVPDSQKKDNLTGVDNSITEVIALTSKEDNSIYLYDLRNGSHLASFNNSQSESNGLALIGSEYFATAQSNKAMVHLYSWKKDQPLFKTPIQERAGPICASNDGHYCAMGTGSGSVYLWEVATGTLLKVWEAHYNKITCITFTKDDYCLITAGDDGIINCWTLEQILDREETLLRAKTSFSDHSLGITSLYCGYGGSNARLFSTSLDRTCKVWDIVSGKSIGSILFPTFLTCLVLDATETTLYVGGGDGIIYQTELITLNNNSADQQQDTKSTSRKTFNGHTKSITSIAISLDGSLLISGSMEGTCNIWDTFSRQVVRSINNTIKGSITSIQTLINPIDSLNFNNASVENKKTFEPIQAFEKYSSNNTDRPNTPFKLKQSSDQNTFIHNHFTIDSIQNRIISTQPSDINSAQIKSNQDEINNIKQESNKQITLLEKRIKELESQNSQLSKQVNHIKSLNENLNKLVKDKLSQQNNNTVSNNKKNNKKPAAKEQEDEEMQAEEQEEEQVVEEEEEDQVVEEEQEQEEEVVQVKAPTKKQKKNNGTTVSTPTPAVSKKQAKQQTTKAPVAKKAAAPASTTTNKKRKL
ncbi:hypothetical protein CYY_006352 [Polysphondylium violaceum]|uniref:WD40 repeat-containing protein n=1 Tax=Polysphondylium violaceum TaxID=133409 RepID=A0A8J4PSB7_9MYCE|nr:hypothetical protein CYY_006352 [Polysphondylium violaceum]